MMCAQIIWEESSRVPQNLQGQTLFRCRSLTVMKKVVVRVEEPARVWTVRADAGDMIRDTKDVERELDPQPVGVDPERAWQALLRDKKRAGDAINVVVLTDDGPTVEPRPPEEVRRELNRLLA